jgi:hypothetical protein
MGECIEEEVFVMVEGFEGCCESAVVVVVATGIEAVEEWKRGEVG